MNKTEYTYSEQLSLKIAKLLCYPLSHHVWFGFYNHYNQWKKIISFIFNQKSIGLKLKKEQLVAPSVCVGWGPTTTTNSPPSYFLVSKLYNWSRDAFDESRRGQGNGCLCYVLFGRGKYFSILNITTSEQVFKQMRGWVSFFNLP